MDILARKVEQSLMNKVIAIIPARWESTRLPGKPLADINGKPMIQWVYDAVKKSKVDKVVVATDNTAILEVVNSFGGEAVMTSFNHSTGTDRVLEAYNKYKQDYDYVINIQGDEPTINEHDINTLIKTLLYDKSHIATLVGDLTSKQKTDRNTVKAVIDGERIMMFTRSPLFELPRDNTCVRHIGIYGFCRAMTEHICVMGPTSNELAENLEQIRWGDNGIRFSYGAAIGSYKGVDTLQDLDHIRTFLKQEK